MPRLAAALMRVIRDERPEYVHVQYMAPGLLPLLVARAMRVPHVLATVHVAASHSPRTAWMKRRVVLPLCDALLFVSEGAERSFFGDSSQFDAIAFHAGRRHFTIYNCIDLARIDAIAAQAAPETLKATIGVAEGPVIGAIGRLIPTKGFDCLIEAIHSVIREIPAAHLVVVGDGPERERLQHQAAQAGIAHRTHFLGKLPYEQTMSWIPAMDVVAATSVTEGFGLTVAEAMAFARPTVTSDIMAFRDIVQDGVTGLVVPRSNPDRLAAAILKLLYDAPQRERLGQAGRKRVEHLFSLASYSRLHTRLYTALARPANRAVADESISRRRGSPPGGHGDPGQVTDTNDVADAATACTTKSGH